MKRILLFLIFILNITSITFGQIIPSSVRFDLPNFVNGQDKFKASLIFKLDELPEESVKIRFEIPSKLKIVSAKFLSVLGDKKLDILKGNNKNELILLLNSEELALDAHYPYQVLLSFNPVQVAKIENEMFVWLDQKLTKSIIEESNTQVELINNQINLYRPQKTAGSNIQFTKVSALNIKVKEENIWNKLYSEFWFNSENELDDFFTLVKTTSQDTIISMSKNIMGFLSFPINNNEIKRNDIYIGDNNWSYFGLLLVRENLKTYCKVFVNSVLAYTLKVENDFELDKLTFKFKNSFEKSSFEIDRLKIWNFDNSLSLSNFNKHFLTYEADSSKILFQSNFDNISEFNSKVRNDNLEIIANRLIYQKSDAPIFSRAPSLTVNVGSTYNSFVWYVQEYSFAKEFIIEKALSDRKYSVVYNTLAEEDPLKIYYFTDEQIENNDVAYYRVKQINNDGTSVYSAEVKVGNTEIVEFNLEQNYPNPFNPITSIYVEVIIPTEFKVKVYDIVGNTVADLHDGFLAEGMHTFEFDGSNIPSGIYFYEVTSPKSQSVKKMILAK